MSFPMFKEHLKFDVSPIKYLFCSHLQVRYGTGCFFMGFPFYGVFYFWAKPLIARCRLGVYVLKCYPAQRMCVCGCVPPKAQGIIHS